MFRILVFLLVISAIKLLCDLFKLVRCFVKNEKYETDGIDRLLRWGAIAYIITIALTGL